jgi:hypothetical protein
MSVWRSLQAVKLSDALGNALKSIQDGSDYLLGVASKLRNVAGTIVNPATEDKQDTVITGLSSIDGHVDGVEGLLTSLDGKDFATETTLATRATETTAVAVKTAVESIQSTDGVKKITDPLPAGTNEIGKVAQGTKGAAANGWPFVLYDASGNPIPVTPDVAFPGSNKAIPVAGTDGTNARVLKTNTSGVLSVTLAVNANGLFTSKLKDGSSNTNMNVDGSGTAVDYKVSAHATLDYYLQELKILLLPNVLRMDGGSFGSLSGPLTNGCELSFTSNSVKTTLSLLKKTEDLALLPGGVVTIETALTSNDLLVVSLSFGGAVRLYAGTSDNIQIKIQDDLTGAGPNSIVTFEAEVSATVE